MLTTLVQADGSWNTTPAAVAFTTHSVVATVSDPAGNPATATQTLTVSTTGPTPPESPQRPDSQFVSLVPARLLESRKGATTIDGRFNDIGLRAANTTTELTVTNRGGIAPDATAAVLNVTITDAHADGYLTVYPCGTTRPTTSNINYRTGSTIANAVITKIGTNGTICLYTDQATHLLVDVTGYFPTGT